MAPVAGAVAYVYGDDKEATLVQLQMDVLGRHAI